MKNIIIYLIGLLLFTPVSCQNKTEKNKKMNTQQEMMFDWQEGTAAPLGFPMQVYEGGLTSMDGTYVGFDNGPVTGYWGQPGSGMSSGKKAIPKLLHVKWLSFAERCFYEVDVELDYDKMLKLFKDGYTTKMGELGMQKKTYDLITVGFAPGGVVVVWLSGTGRETDVGRYQGKKITIPQSEIDKLDSDRRYMFKQSDWQETVDIMRTNLNNDEENNPEHLDLKKKMDNEPIPFGIWDDYRKRYKWKPVFELQNGSVLDKGQFGVAYFNGEMDENFTENFLLDGAINSTSQNFTLKDYEKDQFLKILALDFLIKIMWSMVQEQD